METLKSLIKKKKLQRGLKKPLETYELFGQWGELTAGIIGDKRNQCRPKALKGKTLYVAVDGAPLATELQLRSHELIKKINHHFDKKIVERIVFKL